MRVHLYDKFGGHDRWLNCLSNVGFEAADAVLIWNGLEPGCEEMVDRAKKAGKPYAFVEVGFWDRHNTIHFDKMGIGANSSLCRPLRGVNSDAIDRLRQIIGVPPYMGAGGPVLVPMQVENDQNILRWSPFRDMLEFQTHCLGKFGKDCFFKAHPYQQKKGYGSTSRIVDLAALCSLCYSINSNSLLEAWLVGCPCLAVGEGVFKYHQQRHTLAELVTETIRVTIHADDTQRVLEGLDKVMS